MTTMKPKKLLAVLSGFGLIALTTQQSQAVAEATAPCNLIICVGAVDPSGIPKCDAVIKQMVADLKSGKSIPDCVMGNRPETMVNARDSGNYVVATVVSPIPPCPEGTTDGSDTVIYHTGAMPSLRKKDDNQYIDLPTGEQNGLIYEPASVFVKRGEYTQKICVGGEQLGSIPAYKKTPAHAWYDRVEVMKPDNASYLFTLYINNKIYSSHRF